MNPKVRSTLSIAALALGLFGLVLLALILAKVAPSAAIERVFKGALGSPGAISGSLREASPLLLAGLGVFIALRAGLFNIGVEGQFIIGALVSAIVPHQIKGPAGIAAAIGLGTLAGALWAWPAAWIRVHRGGHEVITTIMLNNIAVFFTSAMISGPFKAPKLDDPSTVPLTAAMRIPNLKLPGGIEIGASLIVGAVLSLIVGYWISRTVKGFEHKAVGANESSAKFAGINSSRVRVRAFCWSGALAGLAGAMHLLCFEGRFYQNFSPGYGFDALGVALLSGGATLGLLPAALFFGALNKGQTSLALLGVPRGLTGILLGSLIMVFAAVRYREARRNG